MSFNVIVTCAVIGSCPLQSPYKASLQSESEATCKAYVIQMMQNMHLKPDLFRIRCETK